MNCVCGKRFSSITAEGVHRHNFPALCLQSKRAKKIVAKEQEKWNKEVNGLSSVSTSLMKTRKDF